MPKITIRNSELNSFILLLEKFIQHKKADPDSFAERLLAQAESLKYKYEKDPARAFDKQAPRIIGRHRAFEGKCYLQALINSKVEVLELFPLYRLGEFGDNVVEDISSAYCDGSIYALQETGLLKEVAISEELYGRCANCGEFTPISNYRPMMGKFQCVCC